MSPFSQIVTTLFDPRGRTSREELLVAAAILVGLELLAASFLPTEGYLTSPLYVCLKSAILWVGFVALIRRLHDCGLSGWTLLGAMAALCMWTAIVALSGLFFLGRNILFPESPGYSVVLGLIMMPAIGATLWMHLQTGELHRNRFGDVAPPLWAKKPRQHPEIA
jgi:uncharacterized membrane protein YhaH (DUF805 family)